MTPGMRCPSVWAAGRRLLALAAIGLVLLMLAACGQASPGKEAAPANPWNPNPAPVDQEDAGLVYAQCVRDNGYPEFPDPDADGRISLRGGHGEGAHDRDDPRLRAAQEACSDLRPAGLDHQDFGDPEFVEQMLAYAQCMRDNGVPDFPDPGPDGRIVVGHGTGIDRNDPRLQAAMQTCYKTVPGVAH